ncbi:hypothetical protein [Dactylosporangium sp. CS-033363]|uniref:hypothetical protein n=1 Tax=Dactylosporangium sp. CS-033363 TaxID=3239935 RepID=UPI003D9399D5
MTAMIPFVKAYLAAATQLRTHPIAGRWARLAQTIPTLTPQEAADWAALGFLPEEAEAQIRSGITAAAYAELEDHAEQQAGGPEALAALRIAEFLAAVGVLGPDDVVTITDPIDPGNEIVILGDAGDDPR